MDNKAIMPGDRSSNPSAMKFSNLHIAISSFAALAGVVLAAYQVFGPSGREPVNVTLAVSQADQNAVKSDADALIETSSIELARNATFSAALNDGSGARYQFAQLFDSNPDTYLTLADQDKELNVLVTFGSQGQQGVTALVYTPPAGVTPDKLATTADIAILPEGTLQASGLPVYSFSLQRSPGSQTFAIPGRASGKAVWIRVAGEAGKPFSIGDFRILKEAVAP